MDHKLPGGDIFEITLIGTGGGYGESVVVHLGNSNWMVVDSCIDPKSKKSLPLDYLEKLGVDLKKDVKLIVCTHWHDDHILGISQILEVCENAIFCMAKPNDLKKFLQLVDLDHRKLDIEISNSSTIEFSKCVSILESRDWSLRKSAASDKILFSFSLANDIHGEVISLSPSDYTMNMFDQEISSLITQYGASSKKIIAKTPNEKSVALFIKVGEQRAILGADLEVKDDNKEGWLNILDQSTVIDKKSSLFKIPHHGSVTGYHERIWVELLETNPISKLTPWNRGVFLPRDEMIAKYRAHTNSLYMTTLAEKNKPKKRSKSFEKMIKRMNINIIEIPFLHGIIQSRIGINQFGAEWEVQLFGGAAKLE